MRLRLHLALLAGALLAGASPVAAQGNAPLRAGDGVRIRVLDEEALSGEFVVDERGILVLPKLGEWRVSEFPADSVRPRLVTALREFLTNPAIEVMPFRRTAIVGAVAQPGLYPVYPSMSVAQAIILAGGPRPDGKENVAEVRLPSAGNGRGIGMEQQVWALGLGINDQIYVPRKSWLRRNGVVALTLALSTTLVTLQILNAAK